MSADEINLSEEQQIISSNELLDQMVKDILKATEQDPAFDAIVENVVGASIQPTNLSAGVQCNIDTASAASQQQQQLISTVFDQQQFAFVQQHQQQLTLPTSSTTTTQQTTEPTTVPRTPIIIRTAISAANTSLNGGVGDTQVLSSLTANNSFGSLIDPNFSLSKLIVLNSNDSAQKQQQTGDQIIGNTTAENIMNHLSNVGDAAGDEQVFIDGSSGQFAIPLLLADEGLLANFPFLINNEGIIQQLQPENIGQLPPNTILVASAQKANPAEEKQVGGTLEPCTACKKPKETTVPSSLQSRSTVDSETPSGSGIVNTKAFKSLSTPRKRTSHVRTLSFSPKPTVSSRAAQKPTLRPNPIAEDNEELANSADISERPIIKNVEILPSLGGPIDASANESSNSCSVPPLFVTEESSNQTVIKTELSLGDVSAVEQADKSKILNKIKSAVADHADTPKRKQIRKTAVRACKRQLSKSSDESETKPSLTKQTVENEESQESAPLSEPQLTEQKVATLKDDKMMEEWLRLRNASNRDLDSRLRQINADQLADIPKSARKDKRTPSKRRYLRRKRTTISKRMRKKVRREAHKKAVLAESEADLSKIEDEPEEVVKPDIKIVDKTQHVKCATDSKRLSKERNKEFNIKIPTPQKDKRESLTKAKSECAESENEESHEAAASDALDSAAQTNAAAPVVENETVHGPEQHIDKERDRRTANIACLLETPFKAPTLLDEIPPTPGKPPHPLDTPAAKLRSADDDIHLSTSYLFGSLTKSELDTPQLSAITPGFRFTPFGSSRDVTPRSATAPTDYSSGGSYYKPDESEDLDRNFEKLLRDSTQKQRQEEEERAQLLEKHLNAGEVKSALFEEQKPTVVEPIEQPEAEAICVEIPAEKLRVEPIVLKRVKSFGAEGADNAEATSNIDPHYTLVSELPEICAEGESSNSSSTVSTSSSSSSQSSTSSSSSSTNSSATTHHEEAATNEKETKKKDSNLSLSLDNLSSISSTEDEEWQKLAVTEEENSQLVSNDGEVRYPVRSWLTPSKVDPQAADAPHEHAPTTSIKVTVPLKSAEKRNRLDEDLQQKRERIMEKLKQDANQRRDKHPVATAALSATRKMPTNDEINTQ
uniref:Uncharacterized protein n=1 Tax=Zeugodacus cucurbitae TaxID=28588 RepID=A0A0A1WPU5_ZEUCU